MQSSVIARAVGPTMLVLLAACAGAADKKATEKSASADACAKSDTTPVGLAVRTYITSVTPTPQRYLSAAGTDSGVPDDGFKVLQDKGPTYFYSGDTIAQRKIREKLASVGPYASLLVIYRGRMDAANGDSVTVRLAGQYVGGEHEGKKAPLKTYAVSCEASRWKIAMTDSTP